MATLRTENRALAQDLTVAQQVRIPTIWTLSRLPRTCTLESLTRTINCTHNRLALPQQRSGFVPNQ